ncbi:dienelactone hydrolase family protein [Aneurinibacillus migulanus]|uniref:Dienelactone hydrolase family protein n=1 Tax=Aneurinibacillus migulanus TaxID=47500 RepID=A0A1G8S1S3_ANEMI|nr:dienelactone hydrolase family protein [Aneurinibacillus migulanus]MED0890703.1 dienelactone hydrolase family protein [Aneurinibacillus migulanus]MED1617117.1 dienelactone hydrolase family protein [Aneurinibacillus migulanus]GED13808.1 hypothetical protein AMI01nite_17990 [Aneurinibacillus migulanus]SDJ23072.1 Dienelactone hydrolase family protein [Aneurinibacillus migulanus]
MKKNLIHEIRNEYNRIYVLGYSVGATTAWLCSEEKCDGVIGYYGSRIRDYLEINPKCPVLLFFPQQEKSFNVDELIASLNKKSNVYTKKFAGNHGFADPYSINFCEESSTQSFESMMKFIKDIHG